MTTVSVVGIGQAGIPKGGVLSVQGPALGGALNVNATIVAPIPLPTTPSLIFPSDQTYFAIDSALLGDNDIIAAAPGLRTHVFSIFIMFGGDVIATIKRGATVLTGPMVFKTGGSFVLDNTDFRPRFSTGVNEAFIISLSAAVQISGGVYFVSAP